MEDPNDCLPVLPPFPLMTKSSSWEDDEQDDDHLQPLVHAKDHNADEWTVASDYSSYRQPPKHNKQSAAILPPPLSFPQRRGNQHQHVWMHHYQAMVASQEVEQGCLQTYLYSVLEGLSSSSSNKATLSPRDVAWMRHEVCHRPELRFLVEMDAQLGLVLDVLADEMDATTQISWTEILQCYRVCLAGMYALEQVPNDSENEMLSTRIKERSMAQMKLFCAQKEQQQPDKNNNGVVAERPDSKSLDSMLWKKQLAIEMNKKHTLVALGIALLVVVFVGGLFLSVGTTSPSSKELPPVMKSENATESVLPSLEVKNETMDAFPTLQEVERDEEEMSVPLLNPIKSAHVAQRRRQDGAAMLAPLVGSSLSILGIAALSTLIGPHLLLPLGLTVVGSTLLAEWVRDMWKPIRRFNQHN